MTPREQVEKRVAAFLDTCRRQGVKATHQRTEILRELASSEEHPDAETILGRVRRRIPAISVDTVYRTLRLLEDKGVIARVGSMRDRARFDANTDRHHHFVCTECGMIGDFHPLSGKRNREADRDNVRALSWNNYRIIYRIDRDAVSILTVRHTKQILPIEETR